MNHIQKCQAEVESIEHNKRLAKAERKAGEAKELQTCKKLQENELIQASQEDMLAAEIKRELVAAEDDDSQGVERSALKSQRIELD